MGTSTKHSGKGDNDETPPFDISELQLKDTKEFLALQDMFAEEHLAFTQTIYTKLVLRDWQLTLLCPSHILEKEGGREAHVKSMVARKEACFQNLIILKATSRLNDEPSGVAGYIMFEVQPSSPSCQSKCQRGKASAAPARPWVQVKQIFVRKALRQLGCAKLLFESMLKSLSDDEAKDIRLCVLDLNSNATAWYRRQGFVVVSVSRQILGHRNDGNVIVYEDMQRLARGQLPSKEIKLPNTRIFRWEVVDEVITISYPEGCLEGTGTFDVRIVDYCEKEHFHFVDSMGLSLWDGDSFTDTINLNEYYRDGYVRFRRHLSLIYRDAELKKREERREKAEAKAMEKMKRALPQAGGRRVRRRQDGAWQGSMPISDDD